MTTLLQKFQARNLPITAADDITGDFTWTVEFTEEQAKLRDEALLEHFNPPAYQKKLDDNLRIVNLNSFLDTSGLAGMDIANVNNNEDRDNLLKAICFQIGLCNSNGIVYSTVQPPQVNNENSVSNL